MKRLLIIDGMNLFIRNYVMSPQLDVNGKPIGGLTGFMRSLQKEVRRAKPDRVVICWEGPGGSQKRREKNKTTRLDAKLHGSTELMNSILPRRRKRISMLN